MKRLVLYIFIFLISLLIFFIINFPIRELLIKFFAENDLKFKTIEGNIFSTKIVGISYDNIYIEDIKTRNYFLNINLLINNSQKVKINPLKKEAVLILKDLKLEDYQLKPKYYGNLNTNNFIIKKQDKMLALEGQAEIFVSKTDNPFIKNLRIDLKLKPEKDYNILEFNLSSENIAGSFKGKLYSSQDLKNFIVDGIFIGNIYNTPVNKNIKTNLEDLLNFRF